MSQGTIWVRRWTSLGDAEKLAEWYISLNERISKKLKAEPYKALDKEGLRNFLTRFDEEWNALSLGAQATRLLSGLIFGQFLPNANHRTAIKAVILWLGLNGIDLSTDPDFGIAASEFVNKSKLDIERAYEKAAQHPSSKRPTYLWEHYWPGHLRSTVKFLECLSPVKEANQSGRWGRIPSIHLESLLTISSGDS